MKYFLNHISPTLAAIARALACEGIGHTHSYAEEVRTIERVLRQLYPAEHPPEDPLLLAAILAVHAMTFGVCAAEGQRRRPPTRAATVSGCSKRDHQRAEAALIALTASSTTR